MTGRWYYFPVVIAVKTPLATLIGLALAAAFIGHAAAGPRCDLGHCVPVDAARCLSGRRHAFRFESRHSAYPADLSVSFRVSWNYRSRSFPAISQAGHNHHPSGSCIGLALETYTAYPDYIPFFNIAAGGWKNGPHLSAIPTSIGARIFPHSLTGREKSAIPALSQLFRIGRSALLSDPLHQSARQPSAGGPDSPGFQTVNLCHQRQRPTFSLASGQREPADFYAKLQSHPPIAVLGHSIYLYNPP